MKCKFDKAKECIKIELFDKWKDDKGESAWLAIGICPCCPVYLEGLDTAESQKRRKAPAVEVSE